MSINLFLILSKKQIFVQSAYMILFNNYMKIYADLDSRIPVLILSFLRYTQNQLQCKKCGDVRRIFY